MLDDLGDLGGGQMQLATPCQHGVVERFGLRGHTDWNCGPLPSCATWGQLAQPVWAYMFLPVR